MCAIEFDPKYRVKQEQKKIAVDNYNKKMAASEALAGKADAVVADAAKSQDVSSALMKGAQLPSAETVAKGTVVEVRSTQDLTPAERATMAPAPNTTGIPLEENEELQEQKFKQYDSEFREYYKKNPLEAEKDIARVVYAKHVDAIAEQLKAKTHNEKGEPVNTAESMAIRQRYMLTRATDKETEDFNQTLNGNIKYYSTNEDATRKKFNEYFTRQNRVDVWRENVSMAEFVDGKNTAKYEKMRQSQDPKYTDADIAKQKQQDITKFVAYIAERETLMQRVPITDDVAHDMAVDTVADRTENSITAISAKYAPQIKELEKTDPAKAQELKNQMKDEINGRSLELKSQYWQDLDKLCDINAEAKLDIEIAKERVGDRTLYWDKPNKKLGDNDVVLSKKLKKEVMAQPELYCREPKAGEKADFTVNGKSYIFDSDKTKEYRLGVSNRYEVDNKDERDAANQADYNLSVKERDWGAEKKHNQLMDLEKKYPQLRSEDENVRKKFLKDHPDVATQYQWATKPVKTKDRKREKEWAKAIGLDYEKDKTGAKRLGHVAKSTLKGAAAGAVSGAASAMIAEAYATTKVVNEKYFQMVQIAGTVGYSGVKAYTATGTTTYHAEGDQAFHVEGDQDYTGKVVVSGDVEYNKTIDVDGYTDYSTTVDIDTEVPYSGKVVINDTIPVDGTVDWSGTGTADFTYDKYDNGVYIGSSTTSKDVTVSGSTPYHQDVVYTKTVDVNGTTRFQATIPVEGQAYFKKTVDVNGVVHFEKIEEYHGTVHYSKDGTVHYSHDGTTTYTHNGEVAYEGEVEYEDEKAVEGTTRGRHRFDWGAVKDAALYGAAIGGATGLVTGIATMRKVRDFGGGPATSSRELVGQKFMNDKPPVPPKTTPTQTPTPTPSSEPCPALVRDVTKTEEIPPMNLRGKNLSDAVMKIWGVDPKDRYAAIGVIKSAHGITNRKAAMGIADLTLFDEITVNGKVYKRNPNITRKDIIDNRPASGRWLGDKHGKKAVVKREGATVYLECDGKVLKTYTGEGALAKAKAHAEQYNKQQQKK